MTIECSIPQRSTSEPVELVASPERTDELWVLPSPELGLIDLPRLRHLLPEEFRDAAVVDFHAVEGTFGAWILRKAG